jgi:hypothetical protein
MGALGSFHQWTQSLHHFVYWSQYHDVVTMQCQLTETLSQTHVLRGSIAVAVLPNNQIAESGFRVHNSDLL